MKPKTIYGLCDPRSPILKICYVGATNRPLAHRLQSHIHEAAVGDWGMTPKLDWIRELAEQDETPAIVPLEVVPVGEDWEARERHWIAHFATVLNTHQGGVGARGGQSEETKRKISKALKGRIQSPELVQKRLTAQTARGYKHSDAAKRKISEAKRNLKLGALPDEVKAKLSAKISSLIWVTDGTSNRRVSADAIPTGWKLGRVKVFNPH